ncbi:putative Aspartic-type endopeptidase ctsD [Glarea lozoyensis 74030]|uniref:Putative Aspartic-type endopeptidase ctsD n=1 Tax=Glarea lozoyensis (strain ATCC 74030 / MF5533) TaxID=1104152 RepID=H0ETZ7_GLAL7|nr:putative Aspartic-type endopeptidase ctsD [Glarea lozoyensis 74030]
MRVVRVPQQQHPQRRMRLASIKMEPIILTLSKLELGLQINLWNVSGATGQDTLSMAGFKVTTTVGVAQYASDDFNHFPMDGILGLSLAKGDSPHFWESMAASKALKSNIFGLDINRNSDGANDGLITFGAVDTTRFTGDIKYYPVADNPEGDWAVAIGDIGFGTSKSGIKGRLAYIDSGTSFIFGPPEDVKKFHALIPGAATTDGSTYTVPCDTTAPASFTFGSETYNISPKDWVSPKVNGACTSNFYGVAVVSETSWLVGDVFLKNVYAVFDYDKTRLGFAANVASPVTTASSSSSASSPSSSGQVVQFCSCIHGFHDIFRGPCYYLACLPRIEWTRNSSFKHRIGSIRSSITNFRSSSLNKYWNLFRLQLISTNLLLQHIASNQYGVFHCSSPTIMRLLTHNATNNTYTLHDFTNRDIPSYAILSHTWGPTDSEITFQDLHTSTPSDAKPGWLKLAFCAAQALKDKLQYFWVDTCCIDKSNPVELQYAINSMFRWYQGAGRCYVYLEDVDGIFGVYIPLIYGEGRENAFVRLREEIDRDAKRAKRGDFQIAFSLEFVFDVEGFVGREGELEEIHSYSAIFWLDVRDDDTLKESFGRVARQILREHPTVGCLSGIDGKDSSEVVEGVKTWLGAVDIVTFLRKLYQGSVLITTRSSKLRSGHAIHIRKFSNVDDSLAILSSVSRRQDLQKDPDAIALAREFDGLPLALATSGAYLDQVSISISSYLRLWIIHVLNQDWDYELATLAVQLIGQHSTVDEKDDRPWLTYRRLLSHASRAVYLISDGLIQEDKVTLASYQLGRLFNKLGKRDDAEKMYERALQADENTLGPTHISTLSTLNSLANIYREKGKLDVAEEMFERALKGHEDVYGKEVPLTLNIINNLGNTYKDQGRLDDAERMYLRAMAGYAKVGGKEDVQYLDTVNNLGNVYADQDEFEKAEEVLDIALKGMQKVLGPKHTSTLDVMNNLALVYAKLDKLVEAEDMYQRAITGYTEAWGAKSIQTLDVRNNLGMLYADHLGRLEDAKVVYEQVLEGYEEVLGKEKFMEYVPALHTIWNLGEVAEKQGDLEGARDFYRRALEGYEKALGVENEICVESREKIGEVDGILEGIGKEGGKEGDRKSGMKEGGEKEADENEGGEKEVVVKERGGDRKETEGVQEEIPPVTEKTPKKSKRHRFLKKLMFKKMIG